MFARIRRFWQSLAVFDFQEKIIREKARQEFEAFPPQPRQTYVAFKKDKTK